MKIGYLMQAGVPDIREKPLSGPANHVKHVCDELRNLGHDVRLIAQLDEGFWVSEDLKNFRPIQVKRRLEWFWRIAEKGIRRIQSTFNLPYAAWFESQRFAQACCQELDDFDILYERMGWMGYGGAIAAKRLDIPWILEVNGDHLDELESLGIAPKGGQKWLSLWLMKSAVHRAAHIVAVGEGWQRRFTERWKVGPEQISVVENGSEMVDRLDRTELRAFQPSPPDTAPSIKLNNNPSADRECSDNSETQNSETQNSAVNLVYIGGFEPWHGVTTLVEAFAQSLPSLQSKQIAPHLYLIGSGSELTNINRLIERFDLHRMVTMTGYLPPHEIVPYLQKAEIGACPYQGRANFSGLKILDYMAAGLVTIASGKDGEPALLQHNETGWIVPPGDVDALANSIVELSTNCEKRRQIGQAARMNAEKLHRWQNTAEHLELIFNHVCERE